MSATAALASLSVHPQIVPRAIYCPVEHAHRSRAVADATRAGRFRHAGVTAELGVEPDWLHATLPADPEWRIEWVKFYYGLDLASAYAASTDRSYLDAWERLVRSWIRQVPPDHDRAEITARRVQNWIYAWMLFAGVPAFSGLGDGLTDALIESIGEQLAHVRATLTPERNHRTLELYALFVGALALPMLDPGGALLDFAVAALHRNLLTDVHADGVHRECSTHYHMVALRSFVGVRENARRFGITLPPSYDERLARACEFAMHVHRPDGGIPMLSDSDTGSYRDVLALAAELLERPDLLWVATAGRAGRPPAMRHAAFLTGGYYVQRSGWGERATPFAHERYLVFDCGPVGDGGHGHYDALSVEVAAGGRPLLVDPGRYSYAEPDGADAHDWGRWFKGTAAHNTVCVDGLDQTAYGRGKPSGPRARARLLTRDTIPGADLLWGEVESSEYEALHRRHVIFVHDEYWVIVDRVHDVRARRYDLRFHLAPESAGRTTVERRAGDWVVHAPDVTLVLAGARLPRLEEGWVAPRYGEKERAPVVSVVAAGEREAEFVTLVVPAHAAVSAPTVRVRHAPTGGRGLLYLELDGTGPNAQARDIIAWRPPSGAVSSVADDAAQRFTCVRMTQQRRAPHRGSQNGAREP